MSQKDCDWFPQNSFDIFFNFTFSSKNSKAIAKSIILPRFSFNGNVFLTSFGIKLEISYEDNKLFDENNFSINDLWSD